ncbi:Fc receptor-like protein 5 [Pungitius pungitius]|uniref:Fc receptor-like protein 5 n=1 Tax=Pungitius pungitius TaxID=134920 RepID=UPI002E1392BA
MFTITDFRAEHSGNYYCEAQNEMGRSTSTLLQITSSGSITAAVASTSAVLLVIIMILAVILWTRRKRSSQSSRPVERPENTEIPTEELCYSTVNFSRNQEDLLYSNIRPDRPPRRTEEVEEVLYSSVNVKSSGAASQCEGAVDDSSALYSTVSKAPRE